ncbi:type II toxin-antitoxin system prevent-host-death family antitoxin [Herbiconiux ginsengi]|uniref:Antitoxin n=1 Tax=Herbiconiux ginsengi TaxID=381665 RepID=A0A1H3KRF6_9MICO|nr:type II toxin-antitoxin system prevent-host-death family antitoxin [Herbiconiux ginsengi]SDY54586.1 prevent-host-death family protein [Herbiconiux ginsengi]
MRYIPASDARQRWAETLDGARREPVTITQHGRGTVMILDVEVGERALAALEDAEDVAAAQAALVEDEPRVSLEEIAKELGITLA